MLSHVIIEHYVTLYMELLDTDAKILKVIWSEIF